MDEDSGVDQPGCERLQVEVKARLEALVPPGSSPDPALAAGLWLRGLSSSASA